METQSPKIGGKFKIFRRPITAEEYSDPCAGIEFDPPRDSDALFDVLRFEFPDGLSHRSRMRDAVIEFLVQERDGERSSISSNKKSKMDSSPLPKAPANTVLDTKTPSENVSSETTGQWKDMTGVWSSTSGLARRPRWRRTMNEQEKHEYRKRRATGACDICKRRKRKCTHDGVDGYEGDSDSPYASPDVTENMTRQESWFGKRKAAEMRESAEVSIESVVGVDSGTPNLTLQEGYQSDSLDSEWMSSIATTPVPPINFSAHEFSVEYPQSASSAVGAHGATIMHEAIPQWWNNLDTSTYQNIQTDTFYLSAPDTDISAIAEGSCWGCEDETYQSGEEKEQAYLSPFRRR